MENAIGNSPVTILPGVGVRRAQFYKKLSIETVSSLISHYPRSYLDLSKPVPIADTIINENNVIFARVYKKQGGQRIRQGLSIFKVSVADESASLIITIFNSTYLFDSLEENHDYYFYGKVTGSLDGFKREMNSPLCIKADETGLIRPIYPLTEGLSNNSVQTNVNSALSLMRDNANEFAETLPDLIIKENNLCSLAFALNNIHFPTSADSLETAKNRLVFEELLVLQLGMQQLKYKNRKQTALKLTVTDTAPFFSSLPYSLTAGQIEAINESVLDMSDINNAHFAPMNRLLQGDVGSGKTVVACALCYLTAKSQFQSAIMAPTQILAVQHFNTFESMLSPFGIRVCLLTSAQTGKRKTELLAKIKDGLYDIIIGTHSLISDSVIFKSLALVVTDEQHRFGVKARAKIAQKGDNPHMLIMSATPIPRTLALLIYGDLDVSIMRDIPLGRQPVDTLVIDSKKRGRALGFVKKQLDAGHQCYIVCPLIEDSESDLVSVNSYIEALLQTPLKNYSTATLNGKLKGEKKDELMEKFSRNEINLLIATTVIEVGIDTPNATVMLIENAERFGLSQLHQLRGRVGRGTAKSYCILISDNQGEDNLKRLEIMKNTTDGFLIAEEDLKLRGPGDFFGLRQHGLPVLKLANYYDDMDMLKSTKDIAARILQDDPDLQAPENAGLKTKIDDLFSKNGQSSMN